MADHIWPLRNKRIAEGFAFFTKSELVEFLSEIDDDDTPVWLNNYWQPLRQITQRPLEGFALRDDGIHFW